MDLPSTAREHELFERLSDEFSEAEIIELTFAIAVENLFSKFHYALRVESHGFCSITPV